MLLSFVCVLLWQKFRQGRQACKDSTDNSNKDGILFSISVCQRLLHPFGCLDPLQRTLLLNCHWCCQKIYIYISKLLIVLKLILTDKIWLGTLFRWILVVCPCLVDFHWFCELDAAASCVGESQDTGSSSPSSLKLAAQEQNEYGYSSLLFPYCFLPLVSELQFYKPLYLFAKPGVTKSLKLCALKWKFKEDCTSNWRLVFFISLAAVLEQTKLH